MSNLFGLFERCDGVFEREVIAHGAHSRNDAFSNVRKERFVPKALSAHWIANMDFNQRDARHTDGISKRNTGVGVSRWIHDQEPELVIHGPMNALDQFRFGIGLIALQANPGNEGPPV